MSVELLPQWWRRIFAWLANRELRKGKQRFHCPSCGAASPSHMHAGLLWEEVMPCPECGDRAPIVSYLKLKISPTEETKFAQTLAPVERPLNTRIVEESTGSGRRWDLPAKGGWNSFLTFSIVWLVFTIGICGRAFLKAENLAQTLAPLAFFGMGLGFLYAGLRMSFARHSIEVDPVDLVYTRRFLGLTKRKIERRDSIESVQLACIYQDQQAVYGLEVKSPSGRIRFGSALEPQEKAWLYQQIREALGMVPPDAEVPPSTKALSEWRGGRLEMEQGSDHALVSSQSRTVGTVALVIGAFFVGLSLFLLQGWSPTWWPWEKDSGVLYFLFNGFTVIWALGVIGAMLISLWLLTFGWISRRTTKMLRADARSLSLAATSGRRVVEHTWSVEDVGSISVVSGMPVNMTPVYLAVVMLPDRVVTFGFGAPREELYRALALLREAMGRTELART